VMPYGLTWPNDPETFVSDAHIFRVIFQPGGTNIPITDAGPPPMCSDLPPAYGSPDIKCPAGVNRGVFASAVPGGANWSCVVTKLSIPPGVLGRFWAGSPAGGHAAGSPLRTVGGAGGGG